jgi:chromosome partitioning protein
MIITVASYKGGVGKTTTALHLAAFFQCLAPTLLVDGDAIRTSIKWSQRGEEQGLPFQVVDEKQTAIATRDGHFQHIIMDTEANPSIADFQEVAKGCDLLVIPAVPETVATDGLTHTLAKLS